MATKKPTARPSVPAFERPLVTVDVVIFTVIDEQLKVLLVRRPDAAADPHPGRLALPGGFINVEVDASLHDCALRKLREKTGLQDPLPGAAGQLGQRHARSAGLVRHPRLLRPGAAARDG